MTDPAAQTARSYRSGLLAGFQHARRAAQTLDVAPTVDDAAKIGAPSDLDATEYRTGYRDGIARFNAGKRSPNFKTVRLG